ncbi:MAG: hypothetical protein ACOYI2_01220 [Bacillota bacterium]|jgi:hypothetical protein
MMFTSYDLAGKKVEDLVRILKPLCESYRMLVDAAEEFNRITLAHKNDVVDAINRADDLGDIIDHVIDTLDDMAEDWLNQFQKSPPEDIPSSKKCT